MRPHFSCWLRSEGSPPPVAPSEASKLVVASEAGGLSERVTAAGPAAGALRMEHFCRVRVGWGRGEGGAL